MVVFDMLYKFLEGDMPIWLFALVLIVLWLNSLTRRKDDKA